METASKENKRNLHNRISILKESLRNIHNLRMMKGIMLRRIGVHGVRTCMMPWNMWRSLPTHCAAS